MPRLDSGELDSLPESAGATATRFRTVIAADVVPPARPGRPYRLGRVGVGNAVPVGDRELVVTPSGPPEALGTLGVVDRIVLTAAEAKLGRGALVARSPSFALFRTPTVLVDGGEHREVDLNYALLVDPGTGALTALCWPDADGPPGSVTRLAPGLSFDARLDARVTRRIGPTALSWSFALAAPPPGERIAVPGPIAPALADPIDPARLEHALRLLATARVATGGGT